MLILSFNRFSSNIYSGDIHSNIGFCKGLHNCDKKTWHVGMLTIYLGCNIKNDSKGLDRCIVDHFVHKPKPISLFHLSVIELTKTYLP